MDRDLAREEGDGADRDPPPHEHPRGPCKQSSEPARSRHRSIVTGGAEDRKVVRGRCYDRSLDAEDFAQIESDERFGQKFGRLGLTFDDVLLVPAESSVLPNDVA